MLFHAEGFQANVFLCNLFEIDGLADMLARPRVEYPTTAALLAEWTID